MASHVVGIDLGSYSVKIAVVSPGFRQATFLDFYEERLSDFVLADPQAPALDRAILLAGDMLRRHDLDKEPVYVAVPGHKVFIHVLEFGFRTLRRAELENAVGAELEGVLPIDLEDMVFTFEQLPRDAASRAAARPEIGEGDPVMVQSQPAAYGRVATPTDGMRVLACAMQEDKARALLDGLAAAGVAARGILAAPASYARVAQRLGALREAGESGGGAALIDIGHERSDVCVVTGGRVDFVRTVARGGKKLTEAIARTWSLDFAAAEDAKHRDGFIGSVAEPPASEAWQRIHDALKPEMAPLARELKRTLSACRAKTGVTVEQVVLVGGGSQVRGITSFLSEQLGVPVSRPAEADRESLLGPRFIGTPAVPEVAALSAGVAFEGASGKPRFDLRKGALEFKADLSFLRARAGQLAAALLVVVAFAAASSYMSLYKLRKAEAVLTERLTLESTKVFGSALDEDEVLARIQPTGNRSPVPKMTAYDTLLEVNAHLPPRDKVKIDVRDLDIKGSDIQIKATAYPSAAGSALDAIDAVETELEKSKCFKEVTPGESQPGADDTREFSLTIKSSC
jgi:general secretion pathway protein L